MAIFAARHVTNGVPSNRSGHIVHVLPSFAIGGVPIRLVQVINHVGKPFRHTIISLDDNFDAAAQFAKDVEVTLLPGCRLSRRMPRSALAAAFVLRRLQPDLLITCNWGSIEWAIANRLLPVARHVHLEDGFGKEEADRQIWRRVLCRRWALARCRLVLPSRRLVDLALHVWKLPAEIVTYLPNGIDVERFAAPDRDTIPGFILVPARLIIAGDGAERPALERLAGQLGISDRVVFVGRVMSEAVLGSFDIFALSSDTEQMPIALLEAMAASRPVAAVDVGDIKRMVCEENRSFIVPRDDHQAFASAIEHLLEDDARRERIGSNNRDRVVTEFSQDRMFAAYSEIFASDAGLIAETGHRRR